MDPQPAYRIAISATFTAEPVESVVAFWGRRLSARFETQFAPYNQPLQTLLDPTSVFAANRHGMNVLLLRMSDLGGEQLEANLKQTASAIRECAAHSGVPLLVVVCPSLEGRGEGELELAGMLEGATGVQVMGAGEMARLYPVANPHSEEGERLGRIPYTELYFAALGTAIVRRAHALASRPYKVIALDCDNTLWSGICGEDGPGGVTLDEPRRALQQFMAEQREQGMLLTLASKNNEADVVETFEQHAGMPLQLRHFAGRRLNWDSKASSLRGLAEELSLGLDSFIFVDDNPKECAEVEDNLPEVLALALPENADGIQHFLEHVWAFDHPLVTEEDRNRSAYYTQSQEFGRELRRAESLEHFIETLELRVDIRPLAAESAARAAQLTQRTNQFNFTTIRRTEAEIAKAGECFTVHARDRFGDYGLVGVIVLNAAGGVLDLDTFLLSCRALGRGVEHRMLAWVGGEAARRGAEAVRIRCARTAKNQPAREFLDEIGVEPDELAAPARLTEVRWKAPKAAGRAGGEAKADATAGSGRRQVDYSRIATALSSAEQILEAMRAETAAHADAGLTETERQLAGIWSGLLNQPAIRATDNFFDLGGHSLLAVLLAMRVRETFGIELPVADVYSASLTLAGLASRIDAYRAGETSPSDYDALLAEIEGMPEEEVRRLLAEEDPGTVLS